MCVCTLDSLVKVGTGDAHRPEVVCRLLVTLVGQPPGFSPDSLVVLLPAPALLSVLVWTPTASCSYDAVPSVLCTSLLFGASRNREFAEKGLAEKGLEEVGCQREAACPASAAPLHPLSFLPECCCLPQLVVRMREDGEEIFAAFTPASPETPARPRPATTTSSGCPRCPGGTRTPGHGRFNRIEGRGRAEGGEAERPHLCDHRERLQRHLADCTTNTAISKHQPFHVQ